MLVQRDLIKKIVLIIEKNADKVFDIQTQYKLIKLKRALLPELKILEEQMEYLSKFYEIDKDGKYIYSKDGGIKIREDCIEQCGKYLQDIYNIQITIPDIYFSLEELAPLELTLNELDCLDFCIK